MQDVLVIGGGVIGLSLAYELAGHGVRVTVVDQGAMGQEASWAGAGMLIPGCLAKARSPEARLRAASFELWPEWTAQLREETGIDNGHRLCGGMELLLPPGSKAWEAEVNGWREEGVTVEPLDPAAALQIEPKLTPGLLAAYRLPAMAQIRNPRHLKALIAACGQRKVTLKTGVGVHGFHREGQRIVAADTTDGRLPSGQFVICSGAWSARLLSAAGCASSIAPVRGQVLLLNALPLPFTHVLNVGRRYLVPRPDGRILVGSTEEAVGFEKRNTVAEVAGLLEFALSVVPRLKAATLERTWSGLRPGSPDELPWLGPVPAHNNLFVAAGHFRAGLLLSPITAVVMRQVLLGQATTIPLEPYAAGRSDRGSEPTLQHPTR